MAAGSETFQSQGNAENIFNKCTRPQIESTYFHSLCFVGLHAIKLRVHTVVYMEKQN